MNNCIRCGHVMRDLARICQNCGQWVDSLPADDTQAGGDHYKTMAVQPWHLMEAILTREEFIGYLKGNLIKYGMRQGKKDSPDADKWHHYKQKLNEVQNG